jgi:hypothetical protein
MLRFHIFAGSAIRRAGATLAILACGIVAADASDGICDGTISSQALKPLPAAKPFDIDVYDNSDENLALRDRFLQALQDVGYPTAKGGPLMISVISERLFPRYRPDTRAVGTPTTEATSDRLGVNRQRSTIENLPPAPRNEPLGPNRRYEEQIEVRFEVRDAETRDFIWLGQLSCSPLTDNRSLIVDAVFDAFVDTVGKTVTNEPL